MDPTDIVLIHQLLARYGHVSDMPPSDLRNELRKEVFSPDGWRIRERVLEPLWGDWPEPVGVLPRSD